MIVTLFTTTPFYNENLEQAYLDENSAFGDFLRHYVKLLNVESLPTETYTTLLNNYGGFPVDEVVQGEFVRRLKGTELTSWLDTMRQNPVKPRVLDE
jgi:hypothetical protein